MNSTVDSEKQCTGAYVELGLERSRQPLDLTILKSLSQGHEDDEVGSIKALQTL